MALFLADDISDLREQLERIEKAINRSRSERPEGE